MVKAVVLKGAGGLRWERFAVTSLTLPGLFVPAIAASASSCFQKRSVS